MDQTGFWGAKAKNAGDSFHELWALHAALELLNPKTVLTALTVEGVRALDSATTATDPWSGGVRRRYIRFCRSRRADST